MINGSYEVMPRDAALPRPGHISIAVCDPFYPEYKGYEQICSEVRSAIVDGITSTPTKQ